MTQSYTLEKMVIIKSGFVLNCMIRDKSPLCQEDILRLLVNNQANFYRFSIFLHMYNLA